MRDAGGVRREVREHDVPPDTFQPRGAEIARHHLYPSDGGNLQQINGDDAPAWLDSGGGHLRPAARRRAQVYYDCSRPQKLFLVVYLEKLERRAGAIALLPRLAHVRIGDMAAQPLFARLRHAPLPAILAPRQAHDAGAGPFQGAPPRRGGRTQMGVERAPVEAPRKRVEAGVPQLRFGHAPQLAALDGGDGKSIPQPD